MNDENPLDRYNRFHTYNDISFYLEDFVPDYEECRILMLKVLEQVVRDFLQLETSGIANDREAWESAADFIFDDRYLFDWGNMKMSPEDFLDILDIDLSWLRTEMRKRYKQKYGEYNG